MKRNSILNLALTVGLLLTLVTTGGCTSEGGGGTSFAPLIIILGLMLGMFYFLMIRPMRQREKKHDEMVIELEKGDIVITAGGIYGQVDRIDEDSVILKVESGATVRVTKGGVLRKQDE